MEGSMLKVLLVEDNPGDVLLVREMLGEMGEDRIELVSVSRVAQAEELLLQVPFDAVLLDLGLPDGSGLETVRKIHRTHEGLPIVVLSGQEDEQTAVSALQTGAQDFLVKGTITGLLLTRALFYAVKRKEMESLLQDMAYHDTLTGLANRKFFYEQLHRSVEWGGKNGKKFAVALLDLDRFKMINDTFGHAVGDRLLQQVGWRLRSLVRKSDTLARMGGDEFAIIFDNILDSFDVSRVLRKILDDMTRTYTIDTDMFDVAFSVGISLFPLDGTSEEDLVRRADRAMYISKAVGSNRFHFYNHETDQRESGRHTTRKEIVEGMRDGNLSLYYQPIVNLRTRSLVGAEALVRWNHPERGFLLPGQFLPDLHGTELMVILGDWVLEEALCQLAHWIKQGIVLSVSVNVDLLQIRKPDFLDKVDRLLKRFPEILPQFLQIEILETAAAGGVQEILAVLDGLHRLGVRSSLDDFGTGRFSLSCLKQLPFDTLKIDKGFVTGMLDNRENLAIIESLASLAGIFGRSAIAEGMENPGYGPMLLKLGCELAQGFGISRPLPPEGFVEWREKWLGKRGSGDAGAGPDLELSILTTQVAHLAWIHRVASLAQKVADRSSPLEDGGFPISPVGPWYREEGLSRYGDFPAFRELEKTHLESLALAEEMGARLRKGNRTLALYYSGVLLSLMDPLLSLYGSLQKEVLFRSLMNQKLPASRGSPMEEPFSR